MGDGQESEHMIVGLPRRSRGRCFDRNASAFDQRDAILDAHLELGGATAAGGAWLDRSAV